ncbi:MAG TPA: hypothetical protein VMI54_13000 [Polyangiaceae bacterium]|nr:hypothetical protein [Polyangiaceae bacterium]
MGTPRFDPTHSLEFNLDRGSVKLSGSLERVLLPADALAALLRGADGEARRDFARRLGTEAGRRVAERLDGSATPEAVAEHLGGELALMGFGSLGFERWGRVLVVAVHGSPLRAEGDEILAGILEGALQRAFGRSTGVVPLQRDDSLVRLLVVSAGAAERVRGWLGSGTNWGEALARLNAGGGES